MLQNSTLTTLTFCRNQTASFDESPKTLSSLRWSNLLPTAEQRTPHSSHSFTSLILQPQTLHHHGGGVGRSSSSVPSQRFPGEAAAAASPSSRTRSQAESAMTDVTPANASFPSKISPTKPEEAGRSSPSSGHSGSEARRNQNAVKNPGGGGTHSTKWETRRTHTRR